MSYTEEEKIKILYEQSLGEIRSVMTRIEGVVKAVNDATRQLEAQKTDGFARSANSLTQATSEIRSAIQQLTGLQNGMQTAAAMEARSILLGEESPVTALNGLIQKQVDAMEWLRKASEQYAARWFTSGLVGLAAGLIGGLIAKHV